jgi:hypothetical protein
MVGQVRESGSVNVHDVDLPWSGLAVEAEFVTVVREARKLCSGRAEAREEAPASAIELHQEDLWSAVLPAMDAMSFLLCDQTGALSLKALSVMRVEWVPSGNMT